jgi:hypothetical protein
MKFRKYTALMICAVLIVAVFSGCGQQVKSPFVSPDVSPSASASASSNPAVGAQTLNLTGAYAALDPKTVMLTVNGKDITWDELFFYISYMITQIESNGGQITSWSDTYQDETTYQEYVLTSAKNAILENAAVETVAKENNITLTDKDISGIQADWDAQVKSAGSEEALLGKLQEQYCTKDIFMQVENINYLRQDCFTSMYGEDGSKLTDQEVADSTAEDGYMMAKHILFMTQKTDETGNTTDMSDSEKAEVKKKAEGILQQLKDYKGDDFDGFFDKLMTENSQDPGVVSFPDGYLFQSDDNMVSQFIDATSALQIGAFTQELVETSFGYHIIYRTPINYDATPMKYSDYGTYPLRFITAYKILQGIISTRQDTLDVKYSDQFNALDLGKIFAA